MLTLPFAPQGDLPLYQQLYQYIKQEIQSGHIPSGEKLPSKRQLARQLHLSVVTIETAYSQLTAEGYLESRDRSGFFVLPVASGGGVTQLEKKQEEIPAISLKEPSFPFDFATSGSDPDSFPFSTWAKLSREVLSSRDQSLLSPIHPQGVYELRQGIVRHLYQFRGVKVSPEQVVIGAGSEFLSTLLVQLLGTHGGYALEDPGYGKIAQIFQASGASIHPIPLDHRGLQVTALKKSKARVVHVTPSHHFPLGTVMPISRRWELLEWANAEEDRYIIEDDYDSEFRFSGRPIPALQGLDQCGKVIYLNTFTKSLAPSLRISYMVLPPQLLERYRKKLLFYASTVPSFEQYTLALFIDRGHLERHIARTRNRYLQRRSAMHQALNQTGMDAYCSFSGGEAGLHLLMSVEHPLSQPQLTQKAADAGIRLYPLDSYYLCEPPEINTPTFVMGYGKMNEAQLTEAFRALSKAWML